MVPKWVEPPLGHVPVDEAERLGQHVRDGEQIRRLRRDFDVAVVKDVVKRDSQLLLLAQITNNKRLKI